MSRENDDEDLRAEARRERAEQTRARHWCSDCHGHTGPGSPCYDGPEGDEEVVVEWEHPCPFRGEPVLTPLGESCSSCGMSAEDME